ncbi:25695_t:CDS:2, partial [Gigaspora rosea]
SPQEFEEIFGALFKNNDENLEKALLAGVSRVAKFTKDEISILLQHNNKEGAINVKILKDIDYNTLSPRASDVIWTLLYFEDYLTMNETKIYASKTRREAGEGLFYVRNVRISPNTENVVCPVSIIMEFKRIMTMINMKYVDESSDEEIKYGNELAQIVEKKYRTSIRTK